MMTVAGYFRGQTGPVGSQRNLLQNRSHQTTVYSLAKRCGAQQATSEWKQIMGWCFESVDNNWCETGAWWKMPVWIVGCFLSLNLRQRWEKIFYSWRMSSVLQSHHCRGINVWLISIHVSKQERVAEVAALNPPDIIFSCGIMRISGHYSVICTTIIC